ncbi:nucleotide sugar dehydrogenase [Gordonibacter massiliensis (ex Traore et al. 2017)]|uniref:nucleotide sugar dehydrogenase n=1 Tax=Gordonibacter massiliensis (ex Traore et al. 2017) TaxID=1841863 RepID=UPI001C8C1043|nr:nucleotide sugar dehydrogenase [Gordonibacter massiliensis (ex Traore et al. 2017)]MBX9034080.1 nucleotide sugar dehydrogenase [Gordonibacter massiliensis (ex Traore et al. 2017)]
MINVIGLGYIGLPTALMFASHGVEVVGTDCNEYLVTTLKAGRTTFKEAGLDELFGRAVDAGIQFTTDYQSCDTYVISVPTPYDKASKKIDPSYVTAAVGDVVSVCPKGATVIIESTVSPGTIEKFVRPAIERRNMVVGEDVHLVHAPERIIPGNMVYELLHNNRTVGADDLSVGERVKGLYASFCQGEIAVTDIRTAEMTKVVENTFRDINIAYANELAKICRSDGMDVHEIIRIANKHPRVNILSPGPGVGGHCISVDPWFLVGDYPGLANIILAARKINDSMPDFVLERASSIMKERGIVDSSKIGIYGLTYKENVDDVRESPTLQMLESMERHLAVDACKVYDPWIEDDIVLNQVHSMEEFLDGLEMVIVMVGHSQIKGKSEMFGDRVLLDARNVLGNDDNVYKL